MTVQEGAPPEIFALPVEMDPGAMRALGKAEAYQAELDLMPEVSPERQRKILLDLDNEWPYTNCFVQITGTIETPVLSVAEEYDLAPDQDQESPASLCILEREGRQESRRYNVTAHNYLQYISRGFVLGDPVELADGRTLGPRIRMLFDKMVVFNPSESEAPRELTLECVADIGDVTISSYMSSAEYAELRAEEHFPNHKAWVEQALEPGLTPSEQIMMLKQMPPIYANHLDASELQTEGLAFSQYLVPRLDVHEEDMPFYATFVDKTLFFDGNNHYQPAAATDRGEFLMEILTVVYRTVTDIESGDPESDEPVRPADEANAILSTNLLEPRIVFKLKAVHRDGDSDTFEVRLRDVELLTNARDFRSWDAQS